MVRLRLQRYGRRNRPFYRLAAVDQRTRRDGSMIEQLGWVDPIEKDPAKASQFNVDRIKYWLGVGAQPSDTVMDFLARHKLIDTQDWEKRRQHRRNVVKKKLEAAAAAPAEEKKK